MLFSNPFLPNNGQAINYTQVFFRWPQIVGTDGYQLKIFENGENEVVITDTTNSNSLLLDEILDWDTSYNWQICGLGLYSEDCFYQNNFTISPLPEHHTDQINILYIDEANYYEGINILDFENLGYSIALDKYGNEIWFADKYNFDNSKIMSVELLDNGNFTGFSYGRGYEFTIDSEIIFETPEEINVHHQILKTTHNTYFIIDAEIEYHPCPDECDPQFSMLPIPWQGDRFIELNSLGEIIWEWNTFDYISILEYNPYYAETYNGTIEFDWTHSNSVFYDEISGAVYVSIRNLSRVTSIDYPTGEINWNLGNSDFMENPDFENEIGFSQQHSVQLTGDGNLIFFDNGRYQDPELSRCVEVEFDADEEPFLLWEHVLPDSMFTGSRGECDRLENNNTLISAGRTGNVIEIDNDNQLIWHLRVQDNHGNDISVYRTQRVANLFPNIFSYEIDELFGEYGDYYIINDGDIGLSIYNKGWEDGVLEYRISDSNEDILVGQIALDSSVVYHNIDLVSYSFSYDMLYTLKLNSAMNIIIFQDISFNFLDVDLGDVNIDENIDILDIVMIVNFILLVNLPDNNEFYLSDFNSDNQIDVLDLTELINFILQ